MKTFKRADRVKHLLQQEVSRILQFEMKDPRVKLLSVTSVTLTSDLREAKVFISSLDASIERQECLAALQRALGYIRGELGRRMTLKFVPTIAFEFDDSLERQERILSLIDEIHHDSDDKGDESGDEGEDSIEDAS